MRPETLHEAYERMQTAINEYVDAEKESTKEFWTRENNAAPPGKTIEVDGELVAVKEDDE